MPARRRQRKAKTEDRARPPAEGELDQDRGVFMISVAAELASMHPQTLRIYEARGLITPKRSPSKTRASTRRPMWSGCAGSSG